MTRHIVTRGTSLLFGLLSLVGCASNPAPTVNRNAPAGTGFVMHVFDIPGQSKHKCTVFVPFDYTPDRSWPTIVFLQGLGEGGSDGVKNTTVGLGPAIAKRANNFDFIAIFPQSGGGTWTSDDSHKLAIGCLDATAKRYNVDQSRVSLTGLSTGGWGTWAIGAKYSNRFAALVPMCGRSGEEFADRLTRMPIWAFHNSGDPFVWADGTKSTVAAINEKGGKARMTIYGALGHDCWSKAYGDPRLWTWLKQQRRGGVTQNRRRGSSS